MMDLMSRNWTDQKGQDWALQDLQQNHLENIEKMLTDIIKNNRPLPEGCNQSIFELKASLRLIQDEIHRRKVNVKRVNTSTVTSVILNEGDSVESIIAYLNELVGDEKLTNTTVKLTFIG